MKATLDTYSQMRIGLTIDDVKELEEKSELSGEVWRTERDGEGGIKPLRLYVKESGWRTASMPSNATPWKDVEAYEVDMPTEGLTKIKNMEVIGSRYPTIDFRTIHIGLENAF